MTALHSVYPSSPLVQHFSHLLQFCHAYSDSDILSFFGIKGINTVFYSWAIAASFLFLRLSPLFSSIADYYRFRKRFMMVLPGSVLYQRNVVLFNKILLSWACWPSPLQPLATGAAWYFITHFYPLLPSLLIRIE